MAVTENDIIQNAAAIAALINTGAANVNITDLDAVVSLGSSDLLHVSVSNVDKKITKANAGIGGGGIIALQGFLSGEAYVGDSIVWLRASAAFTISKIRIGAVVVPTGASIIGDVLYHATDPLSAVSIFSPTTANRPEIAISGHTADSGTPDTVSIADGGWFGLSVDQIGSTVAGSKVVFEIIAT